MNPSKFSRGTVYPPKTCAERASLCPSPGQGCRGDYRGFLFRYAETCSVHAGSYYIYDSSGCFCGNERFPANQFSFFVFDPPGTRVAPTTTTTTTVLSLWKDDSASSFCYCNSWTSEAEALVPTISGTPLEACGMRKRR